MPSITNFGINSWPYYPSQNRSAELKSTSLPPTCICALPISFIQPTTTSFLTRSVARAQQSDPPDQIWTSLSTHNRQAAGLATTTVTHDRPHPPATDPPLPNLSAPKAHMALALADNSVARMANSRATSCAISPS